ncbi:MAG: hypothetical protein K9L32_02185 [Chromatiaceae bacterium]|nr:hypothetical protein [Chromatiaceae bacterium]
MFIPDSRLIQGPDLISSVRLSMDRVEFCFKKIRSPYYSNADGNPIFNHCHSDHMASLYALLAHILYENGNDLAAAKVFYLNKILHGFDCYYTVCLPSIFLLSHPLGTILGGGAEYSNYLMVSQNCTVGDNYDGNYPTLGEGVSLYCGASIIGGCNIGSNCAIGVGASLYKTDLPDDTIVHGNFLGYSFKPNQAKAFTKHFRFGLDC